MSTRRAAALTVGVLSASAILPYLLNAGYRPLDAEVIILSAAAAALGLGAGYMLAPIAGLYKALVAFLVYWIIDCYFVNAEYLLFFAILGAIAAYVAMGTRYRENLQPMLLTFGVVWMASNLFSPPKEFIVPALPERLAATTQATGTLPPVIHVILDAQASPEAVPAMVPGGGHAAGMIVQTMAGYGFAVFTNVISASEHTRHSLTNLFSKAGDPDAFGHGDGDFALALKNNDSVTALKAAGYRVTMVQSNYLDICPRTENVTCHTYNRTGSGHAFAKPENGMGLRLRLALIELHNYLNGSQVFGGVYVYERASALLRRMGVPVNDTVYYSRPSALIDFITSLKPRFAAIGNGEAYVMHLIVPHAPYVLDAECAVINPSGFAQDIGDDIAPRTPQDVYARYWDQSACTLKTLMAALDGLKATPAGRAAVIMIHGDHGARVKLPEGDSAKDKDMLQTLFLLRRGETAGAINREPQILQDLYRKSLSATLQP